MHDGRTRRVESADSGRAEDWLARHRASLVLTRGPAAGSEHELTAPRMLLGRSGDADIRLEDRSVSSEHAAFELGSEGFSIRDLASTNGVRVNGATVLSAELKHGDRIEAGECELQYVVEPRTGGGRTWQLDEA